MVKESVSVFQETMEESDPAAMVVACQHQIVQLMDLIKDTSIGALQQNDCMSSCRAICHNHSFLCKVTLLCLQRHCRELELQNLHLGQALFDDLH